MASDFGCFCLFVVDMSFNPGWWLAPCQASKPDEKSTKGPLPNMFLSLEITSRKDLFADKCGL